MVFQESSRDFWQMSHIQLCAQTMQFFWAIQALGAAGAIPALLTERLGAITARNVLFCSHGYLENCPSTAAFLFSSVPVAVCVEFGACKRSSTVCVLTKHGSSCVMTAIAMSFQGQQASTDTCQAPRYARPEPGKWARWWLQNVTSPV